MSLKCLVFVIFIASAWSEEYRKPMYQYRYQTEDVMKSDATSVPVRGYHVVEGGYYPQRDLEYSSTFGSPAKFSNFGGHFSGSPGFYPSFTGGRYIDGGYSGGEFAPYHHFHHGHHGTGGEYLDKHAYSSGDKKLNDEGFEKASGVKGEQFNQGQEGYNQGKVALKNSKGDSGYYNEQEGGKKSVEDGKHYEGGQHYNQEGKSGGEKNEKGSHKKGHVIKGFKKSHHKDEDGKTEEFYDEEHDEGGNYNYDGKSGSFAEKSQAGYKGGHDNGQFSAADNKKEGHYDSHHAVDNSNADHGQYDQKKYGQNHEAHGVHNGIDQHSLLGHQEANRIFKHRPYHVPFFPVY